MKTKFMVSGSNVHIYKMNEETALDKLPPRIYTIRNNPMTGFYLEITKDHLDVPDKIYGNTLDRIEKCVFTYKERKSSTGILLTGDKGTGKSLLMSLLSNKVIDDLSIPVILINEAFSGSHFTSFIESIGECCLVFDEFGKMYSSMNAKYGGGDEGEVSQQSLLSLMDGVDKTKRLIIMSENSEIDISEFMLNRPSRVYYHFRYKKMDEDSILGYCKDFNIDDTVTKDIIDLSRRLRIFSFDMLKSIVEEHNRFKSSVSEIINDLNIDTREEYQPTIEVVKIIDKNTEEERYVLNSPFIDRPNKYSYISLKPNKNVGGVSTEISLLELSEPEEERDVITISLDDIVFESKGKTVYETNQFTVITKDTPAIVTNYSLLV